MSLLFTNFDVLDFHLERNPICVWDWVKGYWVCETLFSYLNDVIVLVFLESNCGIKHLDIDLIHQDTCLIIVKESSSKSCVVWDSCPIKYSWRVCVSVDAKHIKIIQLLVDCKILNLSCWLAKRRKVWGRCEQMALDRLINSKQDALVTCWVYCKKRAWALPCCFICPCLEFETVVRSENTVTLLES